jgi:hypothetical protein
MPSIDTAPPELAAAIRQFWPEAEWNNAASVSWLESGWNAFADNNTTSAAHECGDAVRSVAGVVEYAEHSVGYFQVNVCNFPTWEWRRLWNAEQNAGTAHMLWDQAGQKWTPWYYSAKALGLLA